ncbi:MAG: thioredoxin [Cytophagales bacterium]|nr:thioredoxin [Cytophagales bacterium]MDW8384503.1 thioredoxin [Flammeovirgaceae bacterium]
MGKAIQITDANFNEVVLKSDKPVLVDFWAEWCGPCRLIAPIIDELASDYAGRVVIGKLDVDANPITASRFGIRSIPTLLVFRNGQVINKFLGAAGKAELENKLLRPALTV